MSVTSIFKGHELFHNLSVEEVNQISEFSERRGWDKGDPIFLKGEKAQKIYLLLEGSVLLRLPAKPPDEYRIVVSRIDEGDLFGLSPLLGSSRYTVEAQCDADTEALVIDADKLRKLLEENSVTGMAIMSEVADIYFRRYIDLLERIQNIVLQVPLIP